MPDERVAVDLHVVPAPGVGDVCSAAVKSKRSGSGWIVRHLVTFSGVTIDSSPRSSRRTRDRSRAPPSQPLHRSRSRSRRPAPAADRHGRRPTSRRIRTASPTPPRRRRPRPPRPKRPRSEAYAIAAAGPRNRVGSSVHLSPELGLRASPRGGTAPRAARRARPAHPRLEPLFEPQRLLAEGLGDHRDVHAALVASAHVESRGVELDRTSRSVSRFTWPVSRMGSA